MTDEISHEPNILPGGPSGQILVWTPPAMPWPAIQYGPEEEGSILLVRDKHAAVIWNHINLNLQGAKPNRWIHLNDAIWIIAKMLNVMPGEAGAVLRSEARPPAVPWVGLHYAKANIDRVPLRPMEINPKSGNFFLEIHIELNHLEAWLEKRKAPVTPRETSPPPKGEPAELKWSDKQAQRRAATEARNEEWATRYLQILREKPDRRHELIIQMIAREYEVNDGNVRRCLPPKADLRAQLAKK